VRAVRLVELGKPLRMQELPEPIVGNEEVLVRIKAAGVCHSDVHYRAGTSPVRVLPVTLGHEIAGIVERVGTAVSNLFVGDRVCLHYLVTCGDCYYCSLGSEQFCPTGQMLGKHRDGGFADYIAVPARNAVPLPDQIPFEQGAVMMCSSATSLHALRKGRLTAGETVAVFGLGGLGMSAVQLARALGAIEVYAVDTDPEKLRLAAGYGATPVSAAESDPVQGIRRLTGQRGVDVSLELIGLPQTMHQAVQVLAPLGRAVLVGIGDEPLVLDAYREILGTESEVIGSNDHLLHELPLLMSFVCHGLLDLSQVVQRTIPLQDKDINGVLDSLEQYKGKVRTVITP
jgi:D-arabinose 1-dehydrogenase-like Zn-dependent alcohol dehydrogenase